MIDKLSSKQKMIDFGFWIVYFNVMIWLRIRIDTI